MACEEAAQILDAALDEWLHAEEQLEQFALLHSPKEQAMPQSPTIKAEVEKLRQAEQSAFGDYIDALGNWDDAAKQHR